MKDIVILSIFLLCLSACGSSPEELAFQTQEAFTNTAASWTETPTRTPTATFTSTPTPTSTSTVTPTPTVTPIPSPTPFAGGGQIAFGTFGAGNLVEYYLMNSDGTDEMRIFNSTQIEVPGRWNSISLPPLWSPSGRYLLLFPFSSNEVSIAYLYDSTDQSVQRVAHITMMNSCIWANDESYILCSIRFWQDEARHEQEGGFYKIFLTKQDPPEYLLPNSKDIYYTLGSELEDGSILAVSNDLTTYHSTLQIINFKDGIKNIDLTEFIEDEDIWITGGNPAMNKVIDGKYYFSVFSRSKNDSTIFYYDLIDQKLVRFLEIPGMGESLQTLALSPDGTMLAYHSHSEQGGLVFRVIDIQTQDIIFEDGRFMNYYISWSPDSRYILCPVWSQFGSIFRIELTTGETLDITPPNLRGGSNAIWSP